jgi:predicted nucleotidyltransferase component of viral defense system
LAAELDFRTEILEKALQLMNLLNGISSHPYLKERLALKGGSALNLFVFNLPRLSVDIDLNYIGAIDRETMLEQRPDVERAIKAVCEREGMAVRHVPEDHAGGKWRLIYESDLGPAQKLQLDLNFMYRVPLWPKIFWRSRTLGPYQAKYFPVLDIHEIAAGKIVALFARKTSRDLFDAHQLLTRGDMDFARLRSGFVAYGAMSRRDWRTISLEEVDFDSKELVNNLLPMLRTGFREGVSDPIEWAAGLTAECREALRGLLPFTDAEMEFLNRVLERGEIEPRLISSDDDFIERIRLHPNLEWKAMNVRKFKGL